MSCTALYVCGDNRWASGDGGYTWSLCALDAEWDDRRYQGSAIDAEGYLYVVAGLGPGDNTQQNRRNDVWRSTISFHNLPAVEAACSLTRPACGYGLTCLPSDLSTSRLPRSVTCKAIQDCGGSSGESELDFRAQTTRALWSGRAAPFVGLLRQPVTYRNTSGATVTAPANSFVLHGTSNFVENDVWISSNRMQTWSLVAGVSRDGFNNGGRAFSPADAQSFTPSTYGGAYGIDSNNRLYRIGGDAGTGTCSTDVWTSVGGVTWTRYTQTNTFSGRMWAQLIISPTDNSLTLFGGRTCAGVSQYDVWRSTNQGQAWNRVSLNTFSAAGPRNGMAGVYRSPRLGREIISYAGGWDGNLDYNDVQASSDGGATWATVTTSAAWRRRDDIAGMVTPDGILILVGGKTNTAAGEVFHNDIWISMDGGYSWGQCSEDLAFTDRRYEAVTLDDQGYLYVVGGETNERNPREFLNDAWRSTLSFTNPSTWGALSQSCGVSLPECGPGLNCWPGVMGTERLPGNRGVSCPACASTAQVPPLDFDRQVENAPWSPRSHANLELYKKTIAYTPVGSTAQVTVSNALVLQGHDNGQENDVWLSTTHGVTWSLVSGISINGRSGLTRATTPMDSRSFYPPTTYPAFALDTKNSVIYRVGGYSYQSNACYGGVVSSVDGKTWAVVNNGVNGILPTREHAAAITDSAGYLYVSGGRQCYTSAGLNDVWRSTDRGKTWSIRTNSVPFGPRLVHLLLNFQANNKLGSANVQMVLGGWTGSADRNDIWATSDGGVVWQLITLGAGWESRDDMNGELTNAGLLIVTGGKSERAPGIPTEIHNDVWVSADGGYSWGQCIKDAAFTDRRYQMTALDEAGYLIVAGGENSQGLQTNDVYRSTISFDNLADVQRACGISIPSCGVGLSCLPNSAGFKRLPGNRGVSCNVCVNNNYASSFDFQRLSGQAGWSARSTGHVEVMPKIIRYTNAAGQSETAPANSLVLHGNANFVENDVWLSSDHGLTWNLISGRSVNGRTGPTNAQPSASTSFSPDAYAPAYAQDNTGGIYRIQGQGSNGATTCIPDVWYSSNGIVWTNQYTTPAPGRGRILPLRRYAAAVGDKSGKIFVSGGTQCVTNVGLNDVWMSVNKGVDWTLAAARAPWSGRMVHAMVSLSSSRQLKNMLVVFTGWTGTTDSNDVWASSDDGRNWRQLTANAQWSARDDSNAEVTAAGLIVMTSGKTDVPYQIHNDLWVSADGGYSWGQCIQDAAFTDRRYQMTVMDEGDYLYVIGGDQSDRDVNDVWRSSLSFSDLNAVAAACKVRMPVCGPGLNCWPNSAGFSWRPAAQGGATCNECTQSAPVPTPTGDNEYSSSTATTSSSDSSGLTTGAVLAIIILVILAVVGMYFAWKYWNNVNAAEKPATGGTDLKDTLLVEPPSDSASA